jgi:multidrug transporter EmrE-like cation transporter
MLYLFGILFAVLLVAGQTLYAYAVNNAGFELTVEFLFSKQMINFLLSWQFILGVILYLAATGINFWMLTKFEFSSIQAVAVPIVLALSFVAGAWFFKDEINLVNILGFFVLVAGIILATLR